MTARPRILLLGLLLLCAGLVATGCGNREDPRLIAETEGIYVDLDNLLYQVQISRQLNPSDTEDKPYFRGIPADERELAPGEVWFAVFLRVQNETDKPQLASDFLTIVSTVEEEFEPIKIGKDNLYAYRAGVIPPKSLIPAPDSPPAESTIQGSLVLFKMPVTALANRPLELKIDSRGLQQEGIVELDV